MNQESDERCSEAARRHADPLLGTAPPARQWLLVEHPGPWGRAGYAGSGLATAVVRGLHHWSEATGGRVVLVRRPGRAGQSGDGHRRWFVADARYGRTRVETGTYEDEHELVDISADPGSHASGETDPLVLVCTHGRHDTCCAVHGRPIAAALADEHPERIWECSHIGGCRFAPALVLLPHGFVYGAIPDSDATRVLSRYLDGTLEPRWLRGRSSLSPVEQAAQQAARLRYSAFELDALRPVASAGEDQRWQVRLAGPDCVVHLIERRVHLERPLTCSMTAPGWQRVFDTVAVVPA